jgi:hypothetical protein
MKKTYIVKNKITAGKYVLKDQIGREKTLITDKNLIVGDTVLVVNDVIVGKVARKELRVYEV